MKWIMQKIFFLCAISIYAWDDEKVSKFSSAKDQIMRTRSIFGNLFRSCIGRNKEHDVRGSRTAKRCSKRSQNSSRNSPMNTTRDCLTPWSSPYDRNRLQKNRPCTHILSFAEENLETFSSSQAYIEMGQRKKSFFLNKLSFMKSFFWSSLFLKLERILTMQLLCYKRTFLCEKRE